MPETIRLTVALVATAALSACGSLAHYSGYRGDGAFVVQPAPSPVCADGYTVDLGSVELTARGDVVRRLDGLPARDAVIGIALEREPAAGAPREDVRVPAARIELTLRDGSGRIVLSRREALTQWTTSRFADDPDHAFAFQRGTEAEIPVAPGAARVERFPIGPDDSWGTYFTPRRGARYTLHFAVEEPVPAPAGAEARLQVRGVAGCL